MIFDRKLSVREAEAAHPGIVDQRARRWPALAKPFGGLNPEWESLKAGLRPGDEIWTFGSTPESCERFAGRQGVALIRDGAVVAEIVTLMT